MLILAGVSLNALVGDNGIITNSIDAKMKNGVAVLEEWLQQKYVEYYDDVGDYANKPELLANKISGLFHKQGTKNYITSALGGGGVKQYYLINKDALPKEIKSELQNGDAKTNSDYISFIDVYGVTEDLKVYYCKNGLSPESVYGNVGGVDIDPNTKLSKINSNEIIKQTIQNALALGTNDVTVGDIQNLKRLSLEGVSDISALSETYSLQELTLKNLTDLANLSGLENCTLIKKLYFSNCQNISDCSELESLINLEELDIYLPANITEEVANTQVEAICNGLNNAKNLTKLKTIRISGYDALINGSVDSISLQTTSTYGNFSNTDYLSIIHSDIKNKVTLIQLNNNNILSLNGISGFNSITEINISHNRALTSFFGLEHKNNLGVIYSMGCYKELVNDENTVYTGLNDISAISDAMALNGLYIKNNYALRSLGDLTECSKLRKIVADNCDIRDISGISGLIGLTSLSMYNNINLEQVYSLGTLTGLTELYLAQNENMIATQVVTALESTGILAQCGQNYSLPEKYKSYFTALLTEYRLSGQGLENDSEIIQKFLSSSSVTNVRVLDLTDNPALTDDCLQEFLPRMTNLRALSLKGNLNVASLNFIGAGKVTGLYELDVRGTNLTDLSVLETYGTELCALLIDNASTDFSKIPTTINEYLSHYHATRSSRITNATERNNFERSFIHVNINYYGNCHGLVLDGDLTNFSFPATLTGITNIFMATGFLSSSDRGTLDLSKLPNLESIYLRNPKGLIKLPSSLKNYTHSTGYGNIDLSACTNLEHIDLDENYDYWTELSSIKKFPPLLTITRSFMTNLDFASGEDMDFSNLTSLSIGFSGNGFNSISGLEKFTALTSLYINKFYKGVTTMDGLYELTNLKRLTIAFTSNCGLTVLDLVDPTDSTKGCLNLEYIEIYNSSNLIRVNGLGYLTNVINLKIYDTSLNSIAGVENMILATNMSLSNNCLKDLSVFDTLILNSKNNNANSIVNLKTLSLNRNLIEEYSVSNYDNAQVLLNLKDYCSIDVRSIISGCNEISSCSRIQNINNIICQ